MQLAQPLPSSRYQRSAHPLAEQGGHLLGLLVHQGCGRSSWGAGAMSKQGDTPLRTASALASRVLAGVVWRMPPSLGSTLPSCDRCTHTHVQAPGSPASFVAHRGRAACRRAWAPASWCTAQRGRAPGPGTAPSPAAIKAAKKAMSTTCDDSIVSGNPGPAQHHHLRQQQWCHAQQQQRQWCGPETKPACAP